MSKPTDVDDESVSSAQNTDYGDDDLDLENSTAMSNTQNSNGDGNSSEEELARKETRAVFRLRVLVILVLFLAAMAVSLAVFFITRRAEKDEFETQFEGSAEKVLSSFGDIVETKIGAAGSLALAITTHVSETNKTFPFATVDSFRQKAAAARSLSEAIAFCTFPYITNETRSDWESYSQKNWEWIYHDLKHQELPENNPFKERPFFVQDSEELYAMATAPVQEVAETEGIVDPEAIDFSRGVPSKVSVTHKLL